MWTNITSFYFSLYWQNDGECVVLTVPLRDNSEHINTIHTKHDTMRFIIRDNSEHINTIHTKHDTMRFIIDDLYIFPLIFTQENMHNK
jgi:hypothetical protein